MRPGSVGRGNRTLDTGIVSIVTDDPTNDVVNAITAPMRAIDVKEVLPDVWLMGRTKAQVRLGVEFSDNPVDFITGVGVTVARKELFAGYITTQGWSYGAAWYDVFNLTGLVSVDYRLYLRFVALAKTTSASTKAEGVQLRVLFHQKPLKSRTVSSPMVRVNTKGSNVTPTFLPVTDPLPAADVAAHRVTAEVMANTGCSLTVGWQQSDTPDDVASWGTVTALGTAITGNAMVYPGKPVTVAPTKRAIRYGVQCLNVGAGTEIESALVRLTIDQRDR